MFKSVQPAAMSLSFADSSFSVRGSVPVIALIASFTPINSATSSNPFSHHDFSSFFSFFGVSFTFST